MTDADTLSELCPGGNCESEPEIALTTVGNKSIPSENFEISDARHRMKLL